MKSILHKCDILKLILVVFKAEIYIFKIVMYKFLENAINISVANSFI